MTVCATCGAENREAARFCDACGAALADAERPREQRKTVTVLFCDVLGSTARAESLDPETTRATMARYFETARTAIERHGGTVEKFIGDAVMAVFGVPQVHEDDALRAVRAAIELRDTVEIEVRIGVNTGRVVTGSGDTLVTGDAVNVAARLEQAATPGEVLIGAETYGLVRDAVDAELLPPLEAKGKSEPLTAYRLVALTGEAGRTRRLDAPLVGRTRESRLLADAWERVRSERACALFTVLGTAGVGKSRLAREFLDGLDATVVTSRCLSYGEGITYWPVVEIAKQLSSPGSAPQHPAVAALLEQSQATADEIEDGVRALLETAAAERPLVALLDDLHWGEPGFLDLVEHVADWSRGAPILLLCLARPELLDRRPGWSGGKLNATTVLLEPLDADETQHLIDGLLGDVELDGALRERILAAAEGNPLFVEEMLAMLVERGTQDVAVPPTIQALLAARIDQLPRPERAALERGAVEGQVFHRGAVQALAPDEPSLASHLRGLVRKELVRPSPTVFPGDDAFRFRHLLIRDAAYEALPKSTRAELHERFADWIAERGVDLVELDEILGYHLEQAARYRAELGAATPELARRAASHLGSSGLRALQRTDLHAAANLLRRSTELLDEGDTTRPRLLSGLGEAVYGMGDVERGRTLLARAAEDADLTGDVETAANARLIATFIRGHMGEAPLASILADIDEAIADLPTVSDEVRARAYSGRGWCKFWLGRCADALEDALPALDGAVRAGSPSLEDEIAGLVSAAMLMGPTPWGELERFVDDRLERGRGHQGGRGGSDMRNHRPLVDAARGDFGAARAAFGELRRVRVEHGATMYDHSVASSVAGVEILAGDLVAAERILDEAWVGLGEAGERGFRSTVGALLAGVLVGLGRLDEAEAVVDESEALASEDDMYTLVSARRARTLLASARGDHEEALAHARDGVGLADSTDYFEQRSECYATLGEVLIAAGRTDEAAEPLRQAIAIAEAKGSTVLAGQARALLDSLTTPA